MAPELLDTGSYARGYFDLREDNINVLDYQLHEMFQLVKRKGGMNPYPRPVYHANEKRPTANETDAYLNERVPVSDIELFNPGDMLPHPDGFELQVRKSLIDHPESGYGVFVKGSILPGTVVALYPGTIYFSNNITQDVIDGNDYMISRYDDVIIDGRSWDRKQEIATKRAKQFEHINIKTHDLSRFRNPYGIGNYVNHPAPGVQPNLMAYSYDFPDEFPDDLKPYVPNEYHTPPKGFFRRPGVHMHALLLISRRKIENEELLLNYRYNPANPYPDWYAQPDLEEAQRRWGSVKVL